MPPTDLTIQESFRRALRSAIKAEDSDLVIDSLLAAVEGDLVLENIAALELAPRAAHLELHLDGPDVQSHATNARSFGVFVLRISEAGKEFVKDRLHIDRFASDILIAPGPGSVRATFIAPDPVDLAQGPLADYSPHDEALWTDANLQSEALHQIAVVLANADPETPESEALDGAIQQLPMASRRHLRTAVNEAAKRDWLITGEFRQRGVGVEQVELKPSAAKYLSSRLVAQATEEDTWRTTGILDGHKWSKGLMYFIPSGRTKSFFASFATSEIQQQVAALSAVPEQKVEAVFTVFVSHGLGEGESGTRSYVIQEIRPLDAGPESQLDFPE